MAAPGVYELHCRLFDVLFTCLEFLIPAKTSSEPEVDAAAAAADTNAAAAATAAAAADAAAAAAADADDAAEGAEAAVADAAVVTAADVDDADADALSVLLEKSLTILFQERKASFSLVLDNIFSCDLHLHHQLIDSFQRVHFFYFCSVVNDIPLGQLMSTSKVIKRAKL